MNANIMEMPNESINEIIEIINFEEETKEKKIDTIHKKNKSIEILEKIVINIFNFICGMIGIIILIPLTIIIYIVSKIFKEDGPIFYTQERIGKNGKTFKMIKYRSMVVGADEILKKYLEENEEAREEFKKYKKLKNDPRITKVGKFLRKTSLDEMPQLLHLCTFQMSLVGPRPYMLREKEDMGEYYNIIIKHTPGITGLWQVHGRSNATFENRLDLDVMYDKNKSIKEDIKILFKTIIHVIKKEGAI